MTKYVHKRKDGYKVKQDKTYSITGLDDLTFLDLQEGKSVRLLIGEAKTHPKDNFIKSIGRSIADVKAKTVGVVPFYSHKNFFDGYETVGVEVRELNIAIVIKRFSNKKHLLIEVM